MAASVSLQRNIKEIQIRTSSQNNSSVVYRHYTVPLKTDPKTRFDAGCRGFRDVRTGPVLISDYPCGKGKRKLCIHSQIGKRSPVQEIKSICNGAEHVQSSPRIAVCWYQGLGFDPFRHVCGKQSSIAPNVISNLMERLSSIFPARSPLAVSAA